MKNGSWYLLFLVIAVYVLHLAAELYHVYAWNENGTAVAAMQKNQRIQEKSAEVLLMTQQQEETATKGSKRFNPGNLGFLNDPGRLESIPPDLIWSILHLKNPSVAVDIGAGTGFFAVQFIKKMPQGKIYAVDVSDEMVSWMKKNLPPETKGSIIPMKSEETSVPLPDDIADLVYMISVHHELDNPMALINESYRLLRKGGTLAIIDWKRETTPGGPPVQIRIPKEVIMKQMAEGKFTKVKDHPVLKHHSFVTGVK